MGEALFDIKIMILNGGGRRNVLNEGLKWGEISSTNYELQIIIYNFSITKKKH